MAGTEYHSRAHNRVYQRKFDHELAKRLHEQGVSLAELGRRFGVTVTAVKRAVDPRTKAMMAMRLAERYAREGNPSQYRGTCRICGGRCRTGFTRCGDCYREQVRRDPGPNEHGELWCYSCEQHRPVTQFPFDSRLPDRGWRHRRCRACETKARQDYRERHKIPCDRCGQPRLPASEKSKSKRDSGLCLACYQESLRTAS